MGTLTGGLKKLAPLFEPLSAALLEKHLAERLFHGDETHLEGFPGHRGQGWLSMVSVADAFGFGGVFLDESRSRSPGE